MPNAVYDDEDQRVSDDDLRDITGIGADEEAAMEAAASEDGGSLTPDQLAEKEADPGSGGGAAPDDSLESRYGNMFKDAAAKDGLYKGGDGSKNSFFKRKGAIGAMGGGGLVVVIMSVFMFNFLHTFQMDHFMKNTEAKTSKRLSASLDTRNKSLMRAYMEMRVMEYEGNTEGKNLFFKGDKVNTSDNPIRNWYETMRKNKFEENVLNKQGITFTGMVDKDGTINVAKITGKDGIDPKLIEKYDLTTIDSKNFAKRLSAIPDEDLEKIFTVDKFDTHKAARKSVKAAVNDEVPWYRVFKRRHIRKDEESVAGIKSWRLFENTRDKIAKGVQNKKNQLYGKMIDIFFSRNPNTANLLKCIFANGSCAKTTDVSDPENGVGGTTDGGSLDESQPTDDAAKAAQAESKTAETTLAGDIKDSTDGVVADAVAGEADKGLSEDAAKKLEGSGLSKRVIYALIAKVTGKEASEVIETAVPIPSPDKIWTVLKWIAKMDKLLGNKDNKAGTSTIAKMVKNAKRAQLIGLFATYGIANDQIKSGQLVGDQLNDFFKTTQGMGNSEGWLQVQGKGAGDSEADKANKKAYCDKDPSERKYTEFAWYCDDQNPGNGGNAQKISDMYSSTLGPVAHIIGEPVNKIQENVVFDKIANFFPDLIGKITAPMIDYASNTGLGKSATEGITSVMMKFVGLLGGGPMFDGSSPGIGNLLVAGGAAQSEATTRQSGGAISNAFTLNYTNQLAAQYDKQQKDSESLYTRYASLDSPDSFASGALFAVSTKPLVQQVGSFFTSINNIPTIFGNMLSGKAFAQSATNASDISDWAGVDKYDIPPACQNLDPLDPDYLSKSSNVQQVIPELNPTELGWDVMRDSGKFWAKVYEKSQDENVTNKIYNCALFDRRVMGNIGALSGYTDDGGYSPDGGSNNTANTGTSGSAASNANLYWVGDSYTVGAKSAGLDTKLGANGWKVTSNGLVSRHMTGEPPSPGGIQEMDQDKAVMSGAGAVVVALGTNDIGASADSFNQSLQTTYDKVKANAPNAKIFWVNYYLKSVADNGKSKTDLLAQFASSHNVTVIDYASVAPPLPYTADGIHPQNYGPLVDKAVETIGKAPAQ